MASLSFKEKKAMFNKKSTNQTNVIRKKSEPSPTLARKLSQLGKKLPAGDDKNIDNNDKTNRPVPYVPKRLPRPLRVKSSLKDGQSRANPVMLKTQSMPASMFKMNLTQLPPASNNINRMNNNNQVQAVKKCTVRYRTLALFFMRSFFATFAVGALFTFALNKHFRNWEAAKYDMVYRVYKELNVSKCLNRAIQ